MKLQRYNNQYKKQLNLRKGWPDMKLQIMCYDCQQEAMKIDELKTPPYISSYPYWQYPVIELDKWPYIEFECDKSHRQRFTLNLELYELLFQQATYCVQDGYYREAIGTYNASLERFFEFLIEILCYYNDDKIMFEDLWKSMRNQSERQLGAYYTIWNVTIKKTPIFLNNDMVKLRNEVVHKGELASREKAMAFGKYVFDYIKDTLKELSEHIKQEQLCVLTMLRLFRICKKDFENAQRNPIEIIDNGEKLYRGVGSIGLSCFLNNEKIKKYEDCFLEENFKQQYGGLIK